MDNKPEEMEPEEEKRRLVIFGRDVSEIPCFRNSFLYGSGAGAVVGLGTFLGTSRAMFATHVGFSSFVCTVFAYWFTCRYDYSQKKFFYNQLKPAMRKQAIYEGTSMEEEATKKAQSA